MTPNPTSYSTINNAITRALLRQSATDVRFQDKRFNVAAFIAAREWYENEYAGGVEKSYGHRTVRLQVEIDRTAALPADYVEWDMVGLQKGSQLVNLLCNPALVAMPDSLVDAVGPSLQVSGQPVGAAAFEYRYTGCWDNIGAEYLVGYGYPYIKAGEFTVQRAERQLLVSSQVAVGAVLYLHYLSDDTPMDGGTPIHPLAVSWLGFYILGVLYETINKGLSDDYKRDAERARSDYMQKRSPFQLEDIYDAMRTNLTWRR